MGHGNGQNVPKSRISHFDPFFGHLNPQNGRLYYQRSTFRGSYSVKSFHKLVLQENVSNSAFFELKVHLQCLKVGVRGQNLQNSTLKWPIKSQKMLQTSQFLVKICVLIIFHGKYNKTFLI